MARLTSQNIQQYANDFCQSLLECDENEYKHADKIADEIGLKKSQVNSIVFFLRRCAQDREYRKFIEYFVISGRDGFALLKKTDLEERKKCFKTLYLRSKCIEKTIRPLEKSLREDGVDIDVLLHGCTEDEYSQELMDEFVNNYGSDRLNREGPDYWQ